MLDENASKLKPLYSCVQSNERVFRRLLFQSGLDLVFLSHGRTSKYLYKKRLIQFELEKKFPENQKRNGYKFDSKTLTKRQKLDIKKIAKTTGLIHIFPSVENPKSFDFANEERFLEDYFNEKSRFFENYGPLKSIESYSFIASVARGYRVRVGSKIEPQSIEEFKAIAFAILADELIYGISQKRISEFLNLDERTINSYLCKNRAKFLIKRNHFVRLTGPTEAYKLLPRHYKYNDIRGVYRDASGALIQQLPNSYKIDKELVGSDLKIKNKTFKFQNKINNQIIVRKQLLGDDNSNSSSLGSYAYKAKLRALKQSHECDLTKSLKNETLKRQMRLLGASRKECSRKTEDSCYSIYEKRWFYYDWRSVPGQEYLVKNPDFEKGLTKREFKYYRHERQYFCLKNIPPGMADMLNTLLNLGVNLKDGFVVDGDLEASDRECTSVDSLIPIIDSENGFSEILDSSIKKANSREMSLIEKNVKSIEEVREQKQLSVRRVWYREYKEILEVLSSDLSEKQKNFKLSQISLYRMYHLPSSSQLTLSLCVPLKDRTQLRRSAS